MCCLLHYLMIYLDACPEVAAEHENSLRYMAVNPTTEAIKPLHKRLVYATSYACNVGTLERPFRTALHIDPNNRKTSISVLVFMGHGYTGGHTCCHNVGLPLLP